MKINKNMEIMKMKNLISGFFSDAYRHPNKLFSPYNAAVYVLIKYICTSF